MNVIIRPPCENDAEAINEIRRQKGVIENILSLGSERITQTHSFISGGGTFCGHPTTQESCRDDWDNGFE